MPYIYTDIHPMYLGRRVPYGTFVEDPNSNRLLGRYTLADLLKAGVVKEISDQEAEKLQRALDKLAKDAAKAREKAEKPEPEKPKSEPKPAAGGDS